VDERFAPARRAGAVEVWVSQTAVEHVAEAIARGRWAPLADHLLALEAASLSLRRPARRLLIEDACRHLWRRAGLVPLSYQLETCRRVIEELHGRAVLADEVGLGKTIEAGMILKEYMLRGLVRRALVLAPATLTWQWQAELREKFDIPVVLQRTEHDWERCAVLVASLDAAKRAPHCDIIQRLDYDLLIVDEAHRLKNARTANWRFVSGIRRKYCLLLTATPVHNDLRELYNLITLLWPGVLGTFHQFQNRYLLDKRTPRNPRALRETLQAFIIRNRRGPNTIELPARRVFAVPVELTPAERRFYEAVTVFVREQYAQVHGRLASALRLITLQRELCSSAPAAMSTLQALYRQTADPQARARIAELLQLGNAVLDVNSKCDELLRLLADSDPDEKFLVFTEYRMTQRYLRWRLEQAGVPALGFDGSLPTSRKEWMRHLFRYGAKVLVSTESGGEGLNFQFCRSVVNFDLPWNPMRMEQRIGRLHRLGQGREVHIYNMATKGTIEEYIVWLLHEKLNMFHAVVGDWEAVLSRLKMKRSFEQAIAEIVLAADAAEAMRRLDELGEKLAAARAEAKAADVLERILS